MYERTGLLLGSDGVEKLKKANICVFGVGGVGGYCVEALVRAGIGHLTVVDRDTVSESNLNRQIIALRSTVGRPKVDVICERALDINPDIDITALNMFFLPENASEIDFSKFDYVVDAVDTVTAKLEIISRARAAGVPVISSMGTGAKLHPEMLEVADIYDTDICPLAKVMRKECRKRNMPGFRCVFSREDSKKRVTQDKMGITGAGETTKFQDRPNGMTAKSPGDIAKEDGKWTPVVPGTVSFVPSAAGLIIAGVIIRDISGCD